MHSGDKASLRICLADCRSFSENAHLKEGHICEQYQYLFQGEVTQLLRHILVQLKIIVK